MPDDYMEYLYRRSAGIKIAPPKSKFETVLDTDDEAGYDCEGDIDDTSRVC